MSDATHLGELKVINLQALRNENSIETEKLFIAAKEHGFFYLDLNTIPEAKGFEALVEEIYLIEEKLFSLSQKELMKYDIDKLGYLKLNG